MFPILLVIAAVTLYAVVDGLAKVMVQDMDVLQIIWSRFAVFGHLPDRWTIVGALVIVGAGLYVAYRERRLARLSGTPAHRSS